MDFGIQFNPFQMVMDVANFKEQRDQYQTSMAHSEKWRIYDAQQQDRRYEDSRADRLENMRRQDTAIQRRVKDALSAGISPLAAMGVQGTTPTTMTVGGYNNTAPQAPRNTYPIASDSMRMEFLTDLSLKAAQTRKLNADANKTETTNYVMQEVVDVPRTDRSHDTARRPSTTSYNLDRGTVDLPSQDWPDLDQIITHYIANQIMNYSADEESRYMWDTLRKQPDRTGRFRYLEQHDDAGSIAP